jgi:hypothetical protein
VSGQSSRRLPPWVAEVATDPLMVVAMTPSGARELAQSRSVGLARFPRIAALVTRAANMAERYPPACRHVLAGRPHREGGPRLCAQHPETGLLCFACMREHIATHTDAEERTCDQCRREVPILAGCMFPLPVQSAHVRGLDGRRRQIPGPVMLACIGLCARCEREAER